MLQQSPQHATNCALKLNIMFKKEEKTTLLMLETAMGLEYHRNRVFPFLLREYEPDFHAFTHLNKRMGENIDWSFSDGSVCDCIAQLWSDLTKEGLCDSEELILLSDNLDKYF